MVKCVVNMGSQLKIEPLTPEKARSNYTKEFPSFVIAAVNKAIMNNMRSAGSSKIVIMQDELVDLIIEHAEIFNEEKLLRQDVFDKGYLDFEDLYRGSGWKVSYDKPGYNENYSARFEFMPTY